jgi:hypothetical protein
MTTEQADKTFRCPTNTVAAPTWTAKIEPDGYWYVYDENDEGQFFFETKKADVAHLIAAAPFMLKVLYAVADHFEGTDAPLGELAKATIAQAEGKP